MTVVPHALLLAGWIPAWWRGAVGADDIVEMVGAELLSDLRALRATTCAVWAYCPELGVDVLPGPKPVTEAAVAAGQAVILQARDRAPATVLVPGAGRWRALPADPARPLDLDPVQAATAMAEAVLVAERELREVGRPIGTPGRAPAVWPLPPDADSRRRGLLVRAVRLWTAVAAVPPASRTPALQSVLRESARAALAAYAEPVASPQHGGPRRVRRPA